MGGTIALVPSAVIGFVILGLVFYSKRIRRRKLMINDPDAYLEHCSGNAGKPSVRPASQQQANVRRSNDSERPATYYGPDGNDQMDRNLLDLLQQQNEHKKKTAKRRNSNGEEVEEENDALEGGTLGGPRDSAHDLHLMQSRFPRGSGPRNNYSAGDHSDDDEGSDDGHGHAGTASGNQVRRRPRPGRALRDQVNDSATGPPPGNMQIPGDPQFQHPAYPQPLMMNNPYMYPVQTAHDGQVPYPQAYHPNGYMPNAYMPNGYPYNPYVPMMGPPMNPDGTQGSMGLNHQEFESFDNFARAHLESRAQRRRQTVTGNNGLLIDLNSNGQALPNGGEQNSNDTPPPYTAMPH
ncbi:hypothetical protein GGF40_003459 [Coemansia sp. RSA 1286]|nr:hypothetical protein GGF40_003459 [Coemansia sp. RSA 1286]